MPQNGGITMIKINITGKEKKEIIKDWNNIPKKFRRFKSIKHGETVEFKCKYPALFRLIKWLESCAE